MKFKTLNNVESTLSISTLIWATLENVKTTLLIWPRSLAPWYDHLKKNKNKASSQKQNNVFGLQRIHWTQNLLHFILHCRRNMQKNICRAAKFLKHQIYWITKTICKPSYIIKFQLAFNFARKHVKARYYYRSFNFICIF